LTISACCFHALLLRAAGSGKYMITKIQGRKGKQADTSNGCRRRIGDPILPRMLAI